MSIETMLFDQDYVTEMHEHELREEARQEERENIFKRLIEQGILTKEEAKRQLELA